MTRFGAALLVAGAAIVGAASGYWYAPRHAVMPSPSFNAEIAAAADRPVLYYRDPTGAPYWSATQKKDAQGRDYLPVYSDDESLVAPRSNKPQADGGERKII